MNSDKLRHCQWLTWFQVRLIFIASDIDNSDRGLTLMVLSYDPLITMELERNRKLQTPRYKKWDKPISQLHVMNLSYKGFGNIECQWNFQWAIGNLITLLK